MKRLFLGASAAAVLAVGLSAQTPAGTVVAPPLAKSHQTKPAAAMSAVSQRELVTTYCATCHNDRGKAGGLSLASFDPVSAASNAVVAEKIIRKLTAGMMPPAGAKRPDEQTLDAFLQTLITRIDTAAAVNPEPGWRPFQRLTRAEYARSVKQLLELELDVSSYLPPDTITDGFDNVAAAQSSSPALLDGYLRAASQISRLAVGDRNAAATTATYTVSGFRSQMEYIDGTPLGSRGGLAVTHVFPADGIYRFTAKLVRTVSGELFGNTAVAMDEKKREPIIVTINGERAAVLEAHPGMSDADPGGLTVTTPPIHVKAGPQQIAIAFLARQTGPLDDLLTPIQNTLIDTRYGTGFGITSAPHLQDVTITGPLEVTGVSDTPSRRRVFSCRPTSVADEETCATAIVRGLATQAFRGNLRAEDFGDLMRVYYQGRKDENFEGGIRLALQAMLAHPRFLFRVEQRRADSSERLTDLGLASRLSYFLWATVPDAALLDAARTGRLSTTAGLTREVRRMLADAKAEALATRFWTQWLRLQDVTKIRPDGLLYPYWDVSLSEGFTRETQLFFDNLVREDRSLLEILTADYSFVNERVARHYGIPNVVGPEFRKVQMPVTRRAGILTQGSTLLLTSVADRTSPVQRGKWVMQVLLASPPPPPPPNVPALEETKGVVDGRLLTVRQRMEQHRNNPACNSCHRVIDPIGLSLENFDVTGRYRSKDNGAPIEVKGQLYDGTALDGPAGLRDALLRRKDAMLRSFTESLFTYAIGRRVEHFDLPTVRKVIREAASNDYRVSSFILGVVSSPAFRMLGPEKVETTNVEARSPR
jgi:mono/diheme cytochrome c family protein